MQFYTVEELAEIFKVSRRTILRLIYSENIKAIKIGNRWHIKKEEVEKLACIGTKEELESDNYFPPLMAKAIALSVRKTI